MRWLLFAALLALAGLSALNWYAQRQTQQKLDALATALAERPAPAPAPPPAPAPKLGAVPREPDHIKLPPYVIEAPDILTIEAKVKDTKTGKSEPFPAPVVSGQHLVRADGTVGLGEWGSVAVSGLTIEQAAAAIRKHLAKFNDKVSADNLAVTVDVTAYNSKRYYVIIGGDSGEQVIAFPIAGSATVLDAVANVNGLPEVASKRTIHVARRTSNAGQSWQALPVDWTAITQHGNTATNYQILPGDRIYVTSQKPQ